MPFPRWGVDGVAGADRDNLAAAGLDQAAPLIDVQCLPVGVAVPRRMCAGREADEVDAQPRRRLLSRGVELHAAM
jgi:hypothetical protein